MAAHLCYFIWKGNYQIFISTLPYDIKDTFQFKNKYFISILLKMIGIFFDIEFNKLTYRLLIFYTLKNEKKI